MSRLRPQEQETQRELGHKPPERIANSQALNLLRIRDAERVQKRLDELSFRIRLTDGFWGPYPECVLLTFKKTNALPVDDVLDEPTVALLFSQTARRAASTQTDCSDHKEAMYPAPPGATLNPLNRPDGKRIQERLAELGYYEGDGSGIWGEATLTALRNFKAMNEISTGEDWDAGIEKALFSQKQVHASKTIVGKWAKDLDSCRRSPHAIEIGGRSSDEAIPYVHFSNYSGKDTRGRQRPHAKVMLKPGVQSLV